LVTLGFGALLMVTFFTHFLQDHFNLVGYWSRLLGSRDLRIYCEEVHNSEIDGATILKGGFTSLVYTVADNTYHLLWFYVPIKMGIMGL
jgi:hypothetical protein